MIAKGARIISCGDDGPAAWALAGKAYAEWKAGKPRDLENRLRGSARAGAIGAAFLEYRATDEWKAKAPRTREDWERAWKRIEPPGFRSEAQRC
jgi:hypothetical protein